MGINKKIATPEELEKHFLAYVADTKENPIKVQDFVGKDGDEVNRLKERPLTIEGFENYCFKNKIINDLGDYFANTDGRYSEFTTICRAIRRYVRQDQIEGGMAGIYNPSITQRLNGLTEKQENTVTANVIHTTLDLGNEIPNTDTPTP